MKVNFIHITITSLIVYFFSQPFLNPAGMGIIINRAPDIYKLASGAAAATGALIYKTRQKERSDNYLPPVHDNKPTFTNDNELDQKTTNTRTRMLRKNR